MDGRTDSGFVLSKTGALRILRARIVSLLTILGIGALCCWWAVQNTSHDMRAELLQQVRLTAQALQVDLIQSLSGTEADMAHPDYMQLHDQLASIRSANPQCRFLYIMGRRADGQIFFYVDAEAPDSDDFSPPGQPYEEAPMEYHRVFDSQTAAVAGPVRDRWGRWITALAPLIYPESGELAAVLGMDVDARVWRWDVAANAALPIGAILVTMIVCIAVLLGSGWVNVSPKPVLRRLFPPLTIMVILMTAGMGAILSYLHRQDISKEAASLSYEMQHGLHRIIEQQTHRLTMLAQSIATQEAVHTALLEGNASGLLAAWRPVFDSLRQNDQITHFYFHDKQRNCIVRIHAPEIRDNAESRFALIEAERTKAVAAGLESGKVGSFALRVAQPVIVNDAIIGYVELAMEFEELLTSLYRRPGTHMAILADKTRLDRHEWETGMRALGREGEWDLLPHHVLAYASDHRLPQIIMLWSRDGWRANRDIVLNGKHWHVHDIPLYDAAREKVGDLLIVRDISAESAAFDRMFFLGGVCGVVLLTSLLAFIFVLLRRTDAGVRAQQAELRENERLLSAIFDTAKDAVFIKDRDLRYIKANDAMAALFGMRKEQVLGKLDSDLYVSDSVADLQAIDLRVLAGESIEEYPVKTVKDGLRYFHTIKAPYRDAHGNICGVCGIARDITEKRAVEDALLRERHFNQLLLDSSPALIVAIGADGKTQMMNRALLDLLGYDAKEAAGTDYLNTFVPEEDRAAVQTVFAHLINEKTASINENRVISKSGQVYLVEWHGRFVQADATGTGFFIGVGIDITERKRAERALSEREETFRALAENSLDVIMRFDPDLRHIYVNPAVEAMTGIPPENFIGKTHEELGFPEDLCRLWESGLRRVLDEGTTQRIEFQLPGGGWVDWLLTPEFDAQRQVKAIITAARDITDRKCSEEQLRRTQFAMDRAGDSILWVDGDAQIIYANDKACESTGYSREELLQMTVHQIDLDFTPDLWPKHVAAMKENGAVTFESRHWTKDGRIFPVEVRTNHLEFDGKFYSCAFDRDITERKRAEEEQERLREQLSQAQKIESVGRLAGGVAHDFNNMLGVILGHTEMALHQTGPQNPLHDDLLEIRKAAERSADLTRQLLAFARKQTAIPKILDLNDTVTGMLNMLRRLIGESVDLAWMPGNHLWPVRIDPSQIDQILANLCVNARDAISGVGRVCIETDNAVFDAAQARKHVDAEAGEYVMLSVTDNGCGIEKDVFQNLFEPFFTTKGVGEGTGLGLPTVYGIVKQNGGFIIVESELEQGAAFKVFLPRHKGAAVPPAALHKTGSAPQGHGTILLVEDEQAILNMTKMMLERLGYTVLSANTPSEAMQLAKEYSGSIDLLMTDVIMPEINGRELANEILAIHPNTKRLFMSGYTADIIAQHGVLDSDVNFIEKPFSMINLAEKLRSILNPV